jgi:hypothetical protein
MFSICTPSDFKIGDTAECRINKQPATLTWRDAHHLVIAPDDVREILLVIPEGATQSFYCADAEWNGPYRITMADGSVVEYREPRPD